MPQRSDLVRPPALRVDARVIVVAGTAVWFVAFVAALIAHGWLVDHDHTEWLWTCLAGWLLGLVGLVVIGKHRREGRTG